jgi:uncharacterized protein YcfL
MKLVLLLLATLALVGCATPTDDSIDRAIAVVIAGEIAR